MLSNYYTLGYIASSLHSTVCGWKIAALYTQRPDEIILQFEGTSKHLIIVCLPRAPAMYLQADIARAKKNSMDLLRAAQGSSITGVHIRPADRVIFFSLTSGARLAAIMYGTGSNVLLIDADARILDAFKMGRKLVNSFLPLSRGEHLQDFPAFRSSVSAAGSGPVVSLVKKFFPVLGATLVTEVFHRAGISPSLAADALTPATIDALEAALYSVMGDLANPSPRLYFRENGVPAVFSLIPLSHSDGIERRYDSIHDAVRLFVSRRDAAEVRNDMKNGLVTLLLQKTDKLRRTRQAIHDDVQAAGRADEYERCARLLMAHLASVSSGKKSITLETPDGAETIPLDPALSPIQNAQRYFDKAKRSRAALAGAAARRPELDTRIARAERLLAEADGCATVDELRKFMAENVEDLDWFGIGEKARKRKDLPFRIFTVEGGFEVWAGKNSANNDLLTLRHAKPDDLWFHARGASGSHVILRVGTGKGEPSRKAREQAAGIAAYYSRMKNAKMVPVAVTEKRYVRKPKGSPPGTVVIEREKVIFAEPAIPSLSRGE